MCTIIIIVISSYFSACSYRDFGPVQVFTRNELILPCECSWTYNLWETLQENPFLVVQHHLDCLMAVWNRWTGLLDWTTGLEYWNNLWPQIKIKIINFHCQKKWSSDQLPILCLVLCASLDTWIRTNATFNLAYVIANSSQNDSQLCIQILQVTVSIMNRVYRFSSYDGIKCNAKKAWYINQ